MSLLIIGAVVGIGGAVGASYLSGSSKSAGISSMMGAVNSLDGLNIDQMNQLASSQDIAKYQQSFEEQAKIDPAYSALRVGGAQAVLSGLNDLMNPSGPVPTAFKALQTDTYANADQYKSIVTDLISQAHEDLANGATLPPAFQAEMIRSGLAAGGAAGTGVAGEGATGAGVRALLGTAGLQLQQERQAQAASLTGAAQTIDQQQRSALAELISLSQNISGTKAQLGGAAAAMGNATVPSIGLSGTEDVNMAIANTQLNNNKKLMLGQLTASKDANEGQMWGNMLGSLTGGISSGLGFGGGGGGAASGGGGMSSGWLSSLLSGGPNIQLTSADLTPATR